MDEGYADIMLTRDQQYVHSWLVGFTHKSSLFPDKPVPAALLARHRQVDCCLFLVLLRLLIG